MRLAIKGECLTINDRNYIRKFVKFVLDMFVTSVRQKTANIQIVFVDPDTLSGQDKEDLVTYGAEMVHNRDDNFTITISTRMIRRYDLLACLAHELVHVKQYLNREVRDYANGDVWYAGKRYSKAEIDTEQGYYNSPWEIESYGREEGLCVLFNKELTS